MPDPRRPYGGPEERTPPVSKTPPVRRVTHPDLPIPQRMREVEKRVVGLEESVYGTASTVGDVANEQRRQSEVLDRLARLLEGPDGHIRDGMAWKVEDLHTRKRIVDKIAISAITTGVIAVVAAGLLLWKGH